MPAFDLAVVALLGFWLALSVLEAAGLRKSAAVKSELLERLIPRWNFFAPVPGTQDFHLLYRDYLASGSVGPWRECEEFAGNRPPIAPIWNPEKRARKTLCDLANTLTIDRPENPEFLKLSMPYLMLLNYVVALPRSELSTETQFVLTETSASDPEPAALLVSGRHSL